MPGLDSAETAEPLAAPHHAGADAPLGGSRSAGIAAIADWLRAGLEGPRGGVWSVTMDHPAVRSEQPPGADSPVLKVEQGPRAMLRVGGAGHTVRADSLVPATDA